MKKFLNTNALPVPANCGKVCRTLTKIVLPVLFALLTALLSSVVSAQEQQESQTPKIYYLKQNQEISHYWNEKDFWYEANGSDSLSVRPSEITNSIFVVGNTFHLRPHRPNKDNKYDTTFGYYYDAGSHTNKLYIGYKVDVDAGTVDLNNYGDGVYGVLHLKTQARRPNEGNITVDDLYVGRGEIFQGETNSTINLHGSVTVEGDLRFRNVAEDKNTDLRIFNIYSSIHGDGMLEFEAGKSRDNHVAEIYLMSSENDFSGKVCVESGTHVHIDDPHEEHDFYDYQTHLFITGENALYNANHVLNEGFIYALANQRFRNYDGDDSYGQFTGVGQLIVNEGVTVELLYDNPDLGAEPIGLITVNNENNNPGTLIFNIPEGMTKSIFMTEDPAEYSKIEGQGTIVKTGNGALKIAAAAEGLVGAESFVISSGRLDMKGYFEGTLQIGSDTIDLDETAVFSPGNSIGALDIEGDFILHDGDALLMEIGGANASLNDQLFVSGTSTFQEGSIVEFILDTTSGYDPEENDKIGVKMPKVDWTKTTFFSQNFTLSNYDELAGIQYLGVHPDSKVDPMEDDIPLAVPEPSTWALLILGAAGLLYWRKQKN
ncbi:MAG: PEP-CTERM sorting domain-containing protein [Thermoguttaceae bacterium]|nr:PEP-CTERM sorting domain-containing protein [Thermoguttaceae bacterium]